MSDPDMGAKSEPKYDLTSTRCLHLAHHFTCRGASIWLQSEGKRKA